MPTYKTPGVYVEEISIFPPSVAEVETAIPAFVGYTELTEWKGESLIDKPVRIKSMIEYEEKFGGGSGPVADSLVVKLDTADADLSATAEPEVQSVVINPKHLLYYALKLFYANGGGPCYIVSVGNYTPNPTRARFFAGIQALRKFDEPTIILFPGAVRLGANDLRDLQVETLTQCGSLMDRVGVFDLREPTADDTGLNTGVNDLRNNIGVNNLKYGAAYAPHLRTSIPMSYQFTDIQLTDSLDADLVLSAASDSLGIDDTTALAVEGLPADSTQAEIDEAVAELRTSNSLYAKIARAIEGEGIVLPPSPAVAGVMAMVDRTRGVWKAPANVSLARVNAPTVLIDDADQESLNVDTNAGKSINAIRAFTGKGVLVWGARTLAGNDNEWRYVAVRRFYNMVEESVKKSTGWAVFEPNAAPLWTKVKSMIENYLVQKWREGALAGAVPEDAFFVKVGLGETMSAQDILEGRLIVEIGMAVVRPAEFIILKFSHKMQES